jgi:predicted DsbA family dithiol-disulfide isomerase
MSERKVSVRYYSDLLCIWAYVAEARLAELRTNFGERVELEQRFVPVFGNTEGKIGRGWSDRGGFEGYSAHVREIVDGFGHVAIHPAVWVANPAPSSHGVHAFVKAAAVAVADDARNDAGRTRVEELEWRLRLAFFADGQDVARLETQLEIASALKLPIDAIRKPLEDGRAFAALAADYEAAGRDQVKGSPTFVLNHGRQRLYGNVGYRIIEANIEELLRDRGEMASWC